MSQAFKCDSCGQFKDTYPKEIQVQSRDDAPWKHYNPRSQEVVTIKDFSTDYHYAVLEITIKPKKDWLQICDECLMQVFRAATEKLAMNR